jgi:glycosyltransferase involved in cell wall biosynthesis
VGKRLLLIAYEFPPKGGTQAQHAAKLAIALSVRGWDVTVITVLDPPSTMLDLELAREAAAQARIVPVWSLEPTRIVQLMRVLGSRIHATRHESQSDTTVPGRRGYTFMPRWAIRAVQELFVPDEKIGWTPYVVREAVRMHAVRPFDVILASGPPFSAYRAAAVLSRRLGLRWVADLRDPIVNGYFFKPLTRLREQLMYGFERRVVQSASRVIVPIAELRDAIVSRVPIDLGCFSMAPNGFDPADFVGPLPSSRDCFVISYVGTFQATIRPDTFLAAFARARELDAGFAADARVRFVGALDAETTTAIERAKLSALVERTGFVSHLKAVTAMRTSSVNLFVLGPEAESRDILTSKLPEYLAAGRPVLGLAPQDGVASRLIQRAGAGVVVSPEDVDACCAALLRLHAEWRAGTTSASDPSVVEEFNRDGIADRVSALLESVVASATSASCERG